MSSVTGRGSILIVDDSVSNLNVLGGMLRERGHRVRAVPSGKLALQAARTEPPDLVLLDINMPEMDGFEVCSRLKADPALEAIPVVFLSAREETMDKVRAFRAGGVDYIGKPFHFEEVEVRVETHLSLRRLRRELERHNANLQELVDQKVREILDSQIATLIALSRLAEYRDEETGNHILRVSRYCRVLAVELVRHPELGAAVDGDFVENIHRASPLHDIGKVGVPDGILLKKGPLTPDEWVVMKGHTTLGARALQAVLDRCPGNRFVRMGVEIAGSHHELWDGSGYPAGLAGEAIPLPARILTVADQYDALRSLRPYKPAFDPARTFEILTKGNGRTLPVHFDPRVLAAFERLAPEFDGIYDELKD